MRICVFCHDSYMSGASLALYDWISYDTENDYMVVLPHRNCESPFYNLSNVEVILGNYFYIVKELKKNTFKFKLKKLLKILYQIFIGGFVSRKMKLVIEKWSPGIIITNSFVLLEGVKIARELKIPHVWHIREFMELDHQVTHYNQCAVEKFCTYSHAIFISKSIEKYYQSKDYHFLSTQVIYDQVKIDEKLKIHNDNYFEGNKINIMIVGILQENKGQMEAIRIAELLHSKGYSVKLDIYGDGPSYNMLNKYICQNSLDYVELKGFCYDVIEKRSLYDISIVCSKNEAFGRVTVESMWAKNITIAARTGASSEILEDRSTGYLYELGDISGCCEIIMDIIKNKEISKLTNCAHNYAESNFCQPIYQIIIEYLKQCIKYEIIR